MSIPPLLAIAEGRKARARKAPAWRPHESKLHCDVADLFRAHCLPDWRWTFINRKAKDKREGAIFKRMGVNRGWGDFILMGPHKRDCNLISGPINPRLQICFLELKRIGEDIEKDSPQDDFRMWCVAHGVPHVVAWTIDDVGAACDAWGCLRVKFARPVRVSGARA